jgi:hypothetical protein
VLTKRSTYLKNDLAGAGEHVFSTYWAITLQIALNTPMIIFQSNHHADITFFAMEKVFA